MNKITIIRIILSVLGITALAQEQGPVGAFASFNRYASASQASLGTSLLSTGSATVQFLNPAGMQLLEENQLSFTYLRLKPNLDQDFMSYAATRRLGEKFSVGVGGMTYHVGEIEGYNEQAEFTDYYSLAEWLVNVSLSTDMIQPFSVGINLKAASLSIKGGEGGLEDMAYGLDYGFIYRHSDIFLIGVSTQSLLTVNDGERSLPRLRTSFEADIPIFKSKPAAAFHICGSTQSEFNHWTTGFLGLHLKYPITKAAIPFINARTPAFLLLSNDPDDNTSRFSAMEEWGLGTGILVELNSGFKLKLEVAYLDEKYFDQTITTMEFLY